MHSFIHPLSKAISPVWESKSDWVIFREIAKATSDLAKTHYAKPVKDIINTPIAHDSAGEISQSEIKEAYRKYDAEHKFNISNIKVPENSKCMAGEILRGIKRPNECSEFGKTCKPANPLGAPMVSSEGACAAYYHFSTNLIN